MPRVTGIGGVFFKAHDAPALQAWYQKHLGVDLQAWGGAVFPWTDADGAPCGGTTVWSVAPEQDERFAPSSAPFMINYRVDDLRDLVAALRDAGCTILGESADSGYGAFAWILDPEGNKIELWQPPPGQ